MIHAMKIATYNVNGIKTRLPNLTVRHVDEEVEQAEQSSQTGDRRIAAAACPLPDRRFQEP